MIFYTYAYLRKDGTPYYIGKGVGYRINSKQRIINPPKDKSRIIKLKQNLTEEEAFKHEIYMIAVFGRKDLGTGILRNRTNGGEGSSGYFHTEESKNKIRKKAIGRISSRKGKTNSLEHRLKLSESHKGRKLSEEHKRKLSEVKKGCKGTPHTEETKKKISETKRGKYIGKNNPMYGKNHKEETKNKISLKAKLSQKNKNLRFYEFLSPNGETVIEYTTLIDFAFKYNLRADCLGKLISGKRKHHKGWTVPQVAQDT